MVLDLNQLAEILVNSEEPQPIDYSKVRETLGVAMGNMTYIDNLSEEDIIEMVEHADELVHLATKGFLPQIDVLLGKKCRRQIRRAI